MEDKLLAVLTEIRDLLKKQVEVKAEVKEVQTVKLYVPKKKTKKEVKPGTKG